MFEYAEKLRTENMMQNMLHLHRKRRMRPIFLTSAAAAVGVPLILGKSTL